MEIPFEALKPETLNKVIESFIVREGTEYGINDTPMSKKIEQVKKQLNSGKVKILYSEKEQSTNIVTLEEYNKYLEMN